jgi:hypothetical protein
LAIGTSRPSAYTSRAFMVVMKPSTAGLGMLNTVSPRLTS